MRRTIMKKCRYGLLRMGELSKGFFCGFRVFREKIIYLTEYTEGAEINLPILYK